jgi:hypothetical protein
LLGAAKDYLIRAAASTQTLFFFFKAALFSLAVATGVCARR